MLLAILAVVLLIFAGIAVDSTVVSTSKGQQRHAAEYLALGALKAYAETTGDNWAKLSAAVARAREIANERGNFVLAEPFLKIAGQPKEIGTNQTGSPPANNGRIIPGRWYFSGGGACTGPSPCPCKAGEWAAPCFRALNFSDPVDFAESANAFRAEVKLRDEAPIRNIFGRVVNQDQSYVTSDATATVIPTHGIFAVDLSRSSNLETHIPYESTGGGLTWSSSEYAFRFNKTAMGISSCPVAGYCLPPKRPSNARSSCLFEGGLQNQLYNEIWNYWNDTYSGFLERARGSTQSSPQKHFKSDYSCFNVSYSEYGRSVNELYNIDTYRCQDSNPRICSNYYDGPEPLNSMLYGVNRGLEKFTQLGVPGNMLGAIAFDQSTALDVRSFNLSTPGSTDFETLKRITDIEGQTDATIAERLGTYVLFPRTDANLNLPSALQYAVDRLLTAPDAGQARNFVAYMGDGITLCMRDGSCTVDESGFSASIDEAFSVISESYVPNKIQFDVLLIGKPTRPHTLLIKSQNNPNACMDDEEARTGNPPVPFVDYSSNNTTMLQAFQNASAGYDTGFYFKPNKLYEAVRETGGIWAPVRPPCDPLLAGKTMVQCSSGALDTFVNSKCASASGSIVSNTPYTDSNGRLWCDTHCRSARQQIADYVEKIVQHAPYVLIQ